MLRPLSSRARLPRPGRRCSGPSSAVRGTGGRRSRPPMFFFFQAEDGIRDHCVTGVQTCALPISPICKTIQAGNEGPVMHIGVGAALSVFIMAVPLAVLFSSILLMIASFAKSYKEAQTYIVPMVFIIIIPAIAAMLPGVDLNAKLSLVPILNVSLLCKELVIGTYHWNFIAIIFTSTCAYAAVP